MDLTAEWLNDRDWFEQYIAEAVATPPALTQPELFLLCLVSIRASRREMMAALRRSHCWVDTRIAKFAWCGLIANPEPGKARALVLTEAGRASVGGYTVVRENALVGNRVQVGAWRLATVEKK